MFRENRRKGCPFEKSSGNGQALATLGEIAEDDFPAAFCDAAVRWIKKDIDGEMRPRLAERDGYSGAANIRKGPRKNKLTIWHSY